MVRFSCFNGHIHSSKTKKSVQPSFEAYRKTLQDPICDHVSESLKKKTTSPLLNSQSDSEVSDDTKNVASVDCSLKLEDMKNKFVMESETTPRKGQLKKSQSLGSGLYNEGRGSMDDDIEDETYPEYSCDYSNDHAGVGVIEGRKDGEVSPPYQDENSQTYETIPENNEIIFNDSIFSIGEEQSHLEREPQENSDTPVSGECGAAVNFVHTPRGVVKSCSLPNLGATVSTPTSGCYANLGLRSRSLEDVRFQEKKWKDALIYEMEQVTIRGQLNEAGIVKAEKTASENFGEDNYDSCHYSSSAKDWVMPAVEKVGSEKSFMEETRVQQWVALPNKDFKIKRIEDWVSDLQHCGPLEETDKKLDFEDKVGGDSNVSSGLASSKIEDKVNPGSEAAKRYISSLNAAASTVQLANHGLVVIPFLSAFVSLRVLNLSGNAIVRITAGALPRGLHTLNLSKNNISTIEGLRELTRLRILDLSYNRILRIGHGLASCSSLKELYLAGNKISEVEGLHRLLKLTVLDLRFNKISTAKCLGQLAANYNSLQAISLEGNPAQKNVGDDQLKKYLQSLLPHLAYYNRQTIKVGSLKDSSERSVRIGASSHGASRLDHGKASRKGPRPSSSSALGRSSQAAVASLKPASKSRHARLPPAATKPTTSSNRQQHHHHHHHHHVDFATRIMNLRQELSSMRRSRSEGTLGAL